jgi:hypothetical protein
MERVAAVGPARVAAPPAAPPEVVFANPALPWWVRAAADPACVLALLAAGLLLWGWSATPASWKAAPSAVGAAIAGALLEAAGRSALLSTEALRLGLAIAALPGVLWIAYVAFRWAEGLPAPANRRAIRLSGR